MNTLSFARKNISNNFQNYFLYIVSISFNVGVFYIFYSLLENTDLKNFFGFDVSAFFGIITVMIWLFSAVFIQYSTSFFLKRRHREIGILNILGVHKRKIAFMLMIENLALGSAGILFGILLGSLSQRLVLMILVKLTHSTVLIANSFSLDSFFGTLISFSFIIVTTSLFSFYKVFKLKIYKAFKNEKHKRSLPIYIYIPLFILGLGITWYGYTFAIETTLLSFIEDMFLALFFVLIGTYLLFRSLPHLILYFVKRLHAKKYNAYALLVAGQLSKKLIANRKTFYNISILSAIILTILGTTFEIQSILERTIVIENTYDFQISSTKPWQYQPLFDKYKKSMSQVKSYEYTIVEADVDTKSYDLMFRLVPYSVAQKYLRAKGIPLEPLNSNQVYICDFNFILEDELAAIQKIRLLGKDYQPQIATNLPLLNSDTYNNTLIVQDDVYYQTKATLGPQFIYQYTSANLEKMTGPDLTAFKSSLFDIFGKKGYLRYSFKDETAQGLRNSVALYMLLGIFLCLVFLVSMGSILYFRVLDDAQEDAVNYRTLAKLGFSIKELRRLIALEIAFVFLMPLTVAISHSFFSLIALPKLTQFNLNPAILKTMSIFVIIYGFYYLLSLKSYFSIVNKSLRTEKSFQYRA